MPVSELGRAVLETVAQLLPRQEPGRLLAAVSAPQGDDVEKLKTFYPRSGFVNGFQFQGCTRFAVKLDFIAGLPKAELHVHHVGSASPRIVSELAARHPED